MTDCNKAWGWGQPANTCGNDLSELTPLAELLKILECPVCQDIPLPPINNCSKGHIICNRCRKKINKCPLCKASYTESRNFALESIVQTSKFICDYHEDGCQAVLRGENLQQHHEQCEFRPLNCHMGRLDGCNQTAVDFSAYLNHLVQVHRVIGSGKEEADDTFFIRQTFTESTKPKHNWLCTYKRYDGRVFLTRSFKLGSIFYWSLALIGTDAQAVEYTVKITIDRNNEEQVPKYELTIPVISVRRTKAEIHQDLPHAMLPTNLLKFFCTISETPDKRKRYQWRTQYQIMKMENSGHIKCE